MVFLTAEWKNLAMLNYAVDRSLLEPFVPDGTELDSFEGRTYVTLVGFEFNRSRICGFAAPFHQAFEEVNLRFYVRRGERKGVVFIRELVPRFAVAALARFAFHESYSRVRMSHRIEGATAEYAWGTGDRCAMRIETEGEDFLPAVGSESQFITEHSWGYAARRAGGCLEYQVQHPRWRVLKAKEASFSGDASRFYGAEMAQILIRRPDSAFLAVGSQVTVFSGAAL